MNCCKPEQACTKENGKMLKRIQVLEDGRVPARMRGNWKIEGQSRRITRKECQKLLIKFEMEGSMAQEDCGMSLEKCAAGWRRVA